MRYSFDTVRVNTQVRGDNISLSTLHGLLVVPRVKDFPKLSSWFNIHLAPVNTPVITDIHCIHVWWPWASPVFWYLFIFLIYICTYLGQWSKLDTYMYVYKEREELTLVLFWIPLFFSFLFLIFIKFLVFDLKTSYYCFSLSFIKFLLFVLNTSSFYFIFLILIKVLVVKLTIKLKSRNVFVS